MKKILLFCSLIFLLTLFVVLPASAESSRAWTRVPSDAPVDYYQTSNELIWMILENGNVASYDAFDREYDEISYAKFRRSDQADYMLLEVTWEDKDGTDYSYVYSANDLAFQWYRQADGDYWVEIYDLVFMTDAGYDGNLMPILTYRLGDRLDLNHGANVSVFPRYGAEIRFLYLTTDQYDMDASLSQAGNYQSFLNCFGGLHYFAWIFDENQVYEDGYRDGYDIGSQEGYALGWDVGWRATASTYDGVSSMIGAMFEAPYRFLVSFLDVEILGINLFGLVSGVITLLILAAFFFLLIKVIGHFIG